MTLMDAIENQMGDENMTSEIKTTGDGQMQQRYLHEKRDRQDDMSDVQTSTKRSRTSTTYVFREEEKLQQRNQDLADSSQLKETVAEENIDIPGFTVDSFTKIEPGGVPTARSADSALDISLRSESLVSPAFRKDYDSNKEKTTMPPIIDYATALIDHKYNAFGSQHVNMFEAADLLKCIANIHPVDQRSELERETGMFFCRDWLTHPRDPSIRYLDIYLNPFCDKNMEKVYLSDIYVQVQKIIQAFDENTVEKLKHFIDMLPMTKEVFNYEMNWAVVVKYELHEKIRPWISNIAKNSTEEEAADFVSDILESIKNDFSAL
ncbi:uncharacterized protein LOC113311810 [Papaver somniferum]|uniref:uncharacterized protein LOC113311809 n=1 Tax=Papaver somniferum TaxID=3469 RepID=UPI000E705335|nr:uncharacterized protein LOC113311809 [Papaver somniferum]XP_026416394.1 uncharacterized protein LOC113311810 [Papaver somniferum]